MPLTPEESAWIIKNSTENAEHHGLRARANLISLEIFNNRLEHFMRENLNYLITPSIRQQIEDLQADFIETFPQIQGLRDETVENIYTKVITPIVKVNLNKAI